MVFLIREEIGCNRAAFHCLISYIAPYGSCFDITFCCSFIGCRYINKISANIDKIEAATNVKINYISADNTLQIKDANGTSLIEAKVGQSTNLVQTGTSYVPYIVVSGIALIAVAVLVAKKVTSK